MRSFRLSLLTGLGLLVSAGLLSSSSSVSGFTSWPGSASRFSTRPAVTAEIQRTRSGTSVPGPRTSISSGPRWTESIQTAARSTLGAAGLRLRRPAVASVNPRTARPP